MLIRPSQCKHYKYYKFVELLTGCQKISFPSLGWCRSSVHPIESVRVLLWIAKFDFREMPRDLVKLQHFNAKRHHTIAVGLVAHGMESGLLNTIFWFEIYSLTNSRARILFTLITLYIAL